VPGPKAEQFGTALVALRSSPGRDGRVGRHYAVPTSRPTWHCSCRAPGATLRGRAAERSCVSRRGAAAGGSATPACTAATRSSTTRAGYARVPIHVAPKCEQPRYRDLVHLGLMRRETLGYSGVAVRKPGIREACRGTGLLRAGRFKHGISANARGTTTSSKSVRTRRERRA
jgi:hypothetical protein